MIVHRVAWLLRECMVLPEEIMVLAYNRSAANEIRRRLWALVDADAAGVTVQTLHGWPCASPAPATRWPSSAASSSTSTRSSARRPGSSPPPGRPTARAPKRASAPPSCATACFAGLRFLLVDEYQDINGEHYELICAVAGRTLQTEEDRVSLMVVGDDDQNIYAFGGASVRYIRQFESDYTAAAMRWSRTTARPGTSSTAPTASSAAPASA